MSVGWRDRVGMAEEAIGLFHTRVLYPVRRKPLLLSLGFLFHSETHVLNPIC